ncbi:dethiobiotin synthase [Noviherbaspirillum galbum]|uniref:ATP-dependent dethiobiotin synthetase BioD n=1 Tax=Noviherbaspirillum galbum TaxID=2709383 RepID=A0A6B3SRB2_9BURK|nr:dethiobiotin synthase [Noviherbaspirillum galbum]NEX63244.1 dethiobiotin synthase [Noviherbaspirillum galbum]
MNAMHYFVTGTDTEIGKTLIASAMLHAFGRSGVRAIGMKPIAAGAEQRHGVWRNEDVDMLAAASNISLPRQLTTPYLLRDATAPHIAAAQEDVDLSIPHILGCYRDVAAQTDAMVVEGVGGFRVPLGNGKSTADLAQALGLPVVLVVGLRLGCLNHALLTAEAIAARGLTLAGWVANLVDPAMRHGVANIETLAAGLDAPLLGCVPRLPSPLPPFAAEHLDFSSLPGWPAPSPARARPVQPA